MAAEDPFASIESAIAFTPHDWGSHHRLAWVYGIAVGWGEEALEALADRHGWSDSEVERLRRLRAAYVRAAESHRAMEAR